MQGRVTAYIVCWLLGNGCLFGWNSLLTIEDYFSVVFAVSCSPIWDREDLFSAVNVAFREK